jgi:predicted nucleotidyltransferase
MLAFLSPAVLLMLLPTTVPAAIAVDPTFSQLAAGLPDVDSGSLTWGDFDNDGDLDLLITGLTGPGPITRLYRNSAGTFADAAVGLPGVYYSAAAWGDVDNDGDLDLALSGETGSGSITRIYRNTSGSFVDAAVGLPGVVFGSLAFGDVDNDGDLDLLLSGQTGSGAITRIYRNTAGSFADVGAGLIGVSFGAAAWGDVDKDGDLDLVLAGDTGAGAVTRVYRNTNGSFADIAAGLTGVSFAALALGDYDNDGDLDLALCGDTGGGSISTVYRNTNSVFANLGAGLTGVSFGALAWADWDSDGDLDLSIAGDDGLGVLFTRLYRNTNGSFADIGAGIPGVSSAALAWGDLDGDGDPDLALSGDNNNLPYTRLFRDNSLVANAVPSAPTNLSVTFASTTATFHWSASTDANGPVSGLSYNLRIGSTPGGVEVVPPMAALPAGFRRVVQPGNAGQSLQWTILRSSLPTGFYWSVQAVDQSFAGSPFAQAPATAVESPSPRAIALRAGVPNPFRESTVIGFDLPRAGRADLSVFDLVGRHLRTLVRGELPAGSHQVWWDGRDAAGRRLGAGSYWCRLSIGGEALGRSILRID